MPRPRKCRRVCCLPRFNDFRPCTGEGRKDGDMILTVDEFEAIRLIDKMGLSQEECSVSMRVARTTVQQIYTLARRKLAEALVEGYTLRIQGGDYCLCDKPESHSCGNHCRHAFRLQYISEKTEE